MLYNNWFKKMSWQVYETQNCYTDWLNVNLRVCPHREPFCPCVSWVATLTYARMSVWVPECLSIFIRYREAYFPYLINYDGSLCVDNDTPKSTRTKHANMLSDLWPWRNDKLFKLIISLTDKGGYPSFDWKTWRSFKSWYISPVITRESQYILG